MWARKIVAKVRERGGELDVPRVFFWRIFEFAQERRRIVCDASTGIRNDLTQPRYGRSRSSFLNALDEARNLVARITDEEKPLRTRNGDIHQPALAVVVVVIRKTGNIDVF